MKAVLRWLFDTLSSLGLSALLVLLLALLTWLGTLEQVNTGLYEVQKRYFESIFVTHRVGAFALPLPGGGLVLVLLFVNLVLGGLVRIRKSRQTAGIIVVHVGILTLIASGFLEYWGKDDGHVTLYEGERSSWFQSWHEWELALVEDLGDGRAREHVADLASVPGPDAGRARLAPAGLPFALELGPFLANSRPTPAGPHSGSRLPAVDGFALEPLEREPENERNIAGLYAALERPGGAERQVVLWGASPKGYAFEEAGRRFALELRRKRFPMHFTLVLDDFHKEDHPRAGGMAKSFMSDVTVVEDGSERPVRISMNEPLRHEGLVLYQSSWGPSNARPGDPLFSTFSVARNPTDRWPIAACAVIALGLVLHFSRKLTRTLRAEARPA
jgi:hypothetical protein